MGYMDTSTIAVDKYEYENLILKGRNLSYDALLIKNDKLEFKYLNDKIRKRIGLR